MKAFIHTLSPEGWGGGGLFNILELYFQLLRNFKWHRV